MRLLSCGCAGNRSSAHPGQAPGRGRTPFPKLPLISRGDAVGPALSSITWAKRCPQGSLAAGDTWGPRACTAFGASQGKATPRHASPVGVCSGRLSRAHRKCRSLSVTGFVCRAGLHSKVQRQQEGRSKAGMYRAERRGGGSSGALDACDGAALLVVLAVNQQG